ncbi:response regulator [Aliikangiella maris]|uniref:Response regulator n=2 Tax=Aliikangiella maris TaxID=3162458 RepID=A0ABV2BYZ9_9GAMM
MHVLIVDDVEYNRVLIKTLLEDKYDIFEAESGEVCLEMVNEVNPDIILLDVNMPGLSGYDVCLKLKEKTETKNIPVIFVSALDSPEERLAGFEAGADDYLIKPIDGKELIDKVAAYAERHAEMLKAKNEAASAMNVAMEAMTSSSELGQIIQFVKTVQGLSSAKQVADAVQTIAEDFGLTICALISADKPIYIGCEVKSLEAMLLKKFIHSSERVTQLGIRVLVKSNNIVLLLKNMPIEDVSRSGRLKDHFVVLTDIADGRLATLLAESAMIGQRKKIINDVIELAEKQIKLTSGKVRDYASTVSQTIESMLNELERMLFSLGLDDDQERKLMALADKTSRRLNDNNAQNEQLDNELGVILEALYQLLEEEQ